MIRQRALKVVLVLVGLAFTAMIYPVTMILLHRDKAGYTDAMMGSIYVTLGILLLMAVRNPSAHRSLIAFAAWSSLAHAFVMTIMVLRDPSARELLAGIAIFVAAGIPLLALAPTKPPAEQISTARA
jgi:tryptophan-rich sensory protein